MRVSFDLGYDGEINKHVLKVAENKLRKEVENELSGIRRTKSVRKPD